MKTIYKLLLLVGLVVFHLTASAQLSEPGYPASVLLGLNSEHIPRLLLPEINSDSILATDTCQSCADLYGFDISYQTDFWGACSREVVDKNGIQLGIYRLLVSQPTAEGLHVIFDRFKLADDETMFIYGLNDTSRILGAYSNANNRVNNTFTSNIIYGGDIVIEVNKKNPTDFDNRGYLGISKFIYVFEDRLDFESTDFDCYTNVICAPWYNDWCNEIRSGVQNRWFYLLSLGGVQNSTTVNGIGQEKAANIAFYTLRNLVIPNETYLQVREHSIAAAIILYGNCSPEHLETCKAWQACNIGTSCQCILDYDKDFCGHCVEPGSPNNEGDNYNDDILPEAGHRNHSLDSETPKDHIGIKNTSIYPNPTNKILILNLGDLTYGDKLTNNYKIEIKDVYGRLVYSSQIQPKQTQVDINVESFRHGIYFLNISGVNFNTSHKFMKQ
jgi:hypothetical protein